MKRTYAVVAIGLSVLASASSSRAQQPATDAARAEAGERFDRGLALFNDGDNAGALAELKRAYALVPNVVVLYDIGLVYAQMGRAVDATDALDQVLANPGTLSAERLAIAKRTREAQAARIAEVTIEATVDGAVIDVDGIEVGRTPLAKPLRVTSGARIVGVTATGFAPQRKEVTIAGGEKQTVRFDLVAMTGRFATIAVKTHLPGAELFIDDQHAGTTPLPASISLAPGAHAVELRRPGYVTARSNVSLGDGAAAEVTLEPTEDALSPDAGSLSLDVSETQALVTIDGRPRGVYAAPIRLVRGPHHLLVVRGDFEPVARDVVIEDGKTLSVRVALEPTSEYRSHFVARADAQHMWGVIALVGGGVLVAGGASLVVYDATQRSSGDDALNQLAFDSVRFSMRACDPSQASGPWQQTCAARQATAQNQISNANTRDVFGYAGIAVGAVAAGVGVVLLVTNDDAKKYDPKPSGEKLGALPLAPTLSPLPGGGLVGVVGRF
jgi:hypothetical protein